LAKGEARLMILSEFQLLPEHEQVVLLYKSGIYIGKRKFHKTTSLLFQLEGFYVEVHYSKYRRKIAGILSSDSTVLLEPYLSQIPIEDFVIR
jgi:hypothetical protein